MSVNDKLFLLATVVWAVTAVAWIAFRVRDSIIKHRTITPHTRPKHRRPEGEPRSVLTTRPRETHDLVS